MRSAPRGASGFNASSEEEASRRSLAVNTEAFEISSWLGAPSVDETKDASRATGTTPNCIYAHDINKEGSFGGMLYGFPVSWSSKCDLAEFDHKDMLLQR